MMSHYRISETGQAITTGPKAQTTVKVLSRKSEVGLGREHGAYYRHRQTSLGNKLKRLILLSFVLRLRHFTYARANKSV